MSQPLVMEAAPWDHFRRASADLLRDRELLQRHDTKLCLRAALLPELFAQLSSSYDLLWAGSSPVATYDTLYFDTRDLRSFHDHRQGRRRRAKIRMRHYPDRQLTYFEVKAKGSRDSTAKTRVSRRFGDDTLDGENLALVRRTSDRFDEEIRPVLWTRFRRLTLLARSRPERVTIDVDLRFDGADGGCAALPGLCIIEVKQSAADRGSAMLRAVDALGASVRPVSKYCAGVVLLGIAGRVGGFAARLRRMKGSCA
jgi:hypothetical protein